MTDSARIQTLVDEQLALIEDGARRDSLAKLMVPTRQEERDWDYGAEGERYPYWVVAEAPDRGILLVYCEHGFGPEMPWGFLFTDEPDFPTLGMDSQWGWYLEEAFINAGLWKGGTKRDDAYHLSPKERFGPQSSR
jgi:hypothetical protein